jgi:hypothetical protein
MRVLELDTREAPNKWWALQDRRIRNTANKSLYTQAQQIRMDRIRLALEMVVAGQIFEVNYGKLGASVKIKSGYKVKDRKTLTLLENDWSKENIVRKETAQGTLYYMPRQ